MPKTITVATEEELIAEYETWIPITELIGEDISGRKAITTDPMYHYQYPQGVPVRTMLAVFRTKRDGYFWVTMHWQKDPQVPYDCGFSGYREDGGKVLRLKWVEA